MGEVLNMNAPVTIIEQSDPLTAFDRFIAVYPRQASVGTARGRWIWALAKVNNDHDLLIRAAAACALFHQSRHTAIEFIAKPHAWLDAEGWLDRYELPKAPVAPPYEPGKLRYESLKANAAKGNRFSADLLKRDYGE